MVTSVSFVIKLLKPVYVEAGLNVVLPAFTVTSQLALLVLSALLVAVTVAEPAEMPLA
jgi:hypothetical protein